MLAVFIERDRLRKVVDAAVHAHADIPAAAGIVEHLLVLALTCTDDRRQDLHARRLRQRRDLIDDLIHRLAADLLAALRAGKSGGKEGDGTGKNRIEECGQDRDLVLHEGVKREFTTGDLFEPLFPLCRHHRVFEHTRSHVDERLAKWC